MALDPQVFSKECSLKHESNQSQGIGATNHKEALSNKTHVMDLQEDLQQIPLGVIPPTSELVSEMGVKQPPWKFLIPVGKHTIWSIGRLMVAAGKKVDISYCVCNMLCVICGELPLNAMCSFHKSMCCTAVFTKVQKSKTLTFSSDLINMVASSILTIASDLCVRTDNEFLARQQIVVTSLMKKQYGLDSHPKYLHLQPLSPLLNVVYNRIGATLVRYGSLPHADPFWTGANGYLSFLFRWARNCELQNVSVALTFLDGKVTALGPTLENEVSSAQACVKSLHEAYPHSSYIGLLAEPISAMFSINELVALQYLGHSLRLATGFLNETDFKRLWRLKPVVKHEIKAIIANCGFK